MKVIPETRRGNYIRYHTILQTRLFRYVMITVRCKKKKNQKKNHTHTQERKKQTNSHTTNKKEQGVR